MAKTHYKKGQAAAKKIAGQAAIELAVFGAILIFILGTIVNSAVGNSYAQSQNFKAMRMAMLASWNGAQQANGLSANISRNSASILFVEDRLSPEISKYGSLERSPQIANGSGTMSYEMLYPVDATDISNGQNMPIMDVYINGQHFPFTTAAYVPNKIISRGDYFNCPAGGPFIPPRNQQECLTNQCLRNQREWAGGIVRATDFVNVVPIPSQASNSSNAIFAQLAMRGMITQSQSDAAIGYVSPTFTTTGVLSTEFENWFTGPAVVSPSGAITYPTPAITGDTADLAAQLSTIQSILQQDSHQYKLFYSQAVNGQPPTQMPQFTPVAPICSAHPCENQELSQDLILANNSGGTTTNTNGDLMYDLQRNGLTNDQIEKEFPPGAAACPSAMNIAPTPYMRCAVAWQWSASAGVPGQNAVYIDTDNNNYPSYDIDGRLKTVTIYSITAPDQNGSVTVSYEDPQLGDIDGGWNPNSCGPKPGLQTDTQIYTFTSPPNGTPTYLEIKEGKLYNPESGQVVRSVNQRDNVDLIQRMVQLSNNTGRFCTVPATPTSATSWVSTVDGGPNPVEVCVNSNDSSKVDCFNGNSTAVSGSNPNEQNIKQTCLDVGTNMLYVRSRLEDRRGRFWITDTSGPLKVQ